MKKVAIELPKNQYISLSIQNKNELVIRASDEMTENLSCSANEVFVAYLELWGNGGVTVFSSADFKEHNYQQGIADGLTLAADKIQALLDQNGIP